jgi:phage minor structural protein, N-terminal region
MYRVMCGDYILYDRNILTAKAESPVLSREDNAFGSLCCTIYSDHPAYTHMNVLNTNATVYDGSTIIWQGRLISKRQGLRGALRLNFEGNLGYLADSVIEPFDFSGGVQDFFEFIVSKHNESVEEHQRFKIGNCTVTDENDYIVRSSVDRLSAWDVVNTRLLDLLGGHLVIRYESGDRYLDYLSEFPYTAVQKIEYGQNIVDLFCEDDALETYTAVYPLGAKDENDERLTIGSVNNGINFVEDASRVATYGRIFAPREDTTWDDVTVASNLLTKATQYLQQKAMLFRETVEVTAIDLHNADPSIQSFRFGERIIVNSMPNGIDATYDCTALTEYIDNPANNSFVLGATRLSYTQSVQKGTSAQKADILKTVADNYATTNEAHVIAQEEIQQDTTIIQRAEGIIASALEQYTKTSDFETFQSTIVTDLSVLAGQVDINFTNAQSSINTLSGQTQQQFSEIRSFIRYIAQTSTVNGGVVIGESTSAVKLKLENDILYFFTGDETTVSTQSAIAYFAAGKLYVNTTQIQQLTIGVSGQLMDFYVAGNDDNRCIMFSGRLV